MDFKAKFCFVVFWICCAPFSLCAQHEEFISRQYTMEDGLAEERINVAIQDGHGFIWIGTSSGLSKFDGHRFINHRNNPASSNSLGHNLVHSLLQDKKGRLWIAHAQGLDLFDPQTEKYFHWPYFGDSTNNHLRVERLRERKDRKIWICTSDGVYVGDAETLKIERFTQLPFYTNDIGETKDGSVVAAIASYNISTSLFDYGVCYIDAKTGVMKQFMHDPFNPKNSSFPSVVYSVKVDKHNRVWVVTNESLALFNPREKTFTHYPTKGIHPTNANFGTVDILENSDGKFWLGCRDGLYTFDPESGKIDKLINIPAVHSAMKDRQGIVWISSTQGLWQIHSKSQQFNIYHQFGQSIGDMAEDINHDIWILGSPPNDATSLFRFKPSEGTTYNHGTQPCSNPPSSPSEYVGTRSLFSDLKGNIWLLSSRKVEKYDAENRKFQNINTISRDWRLKGYFINSGFIDSHGTIWFGNEWGAIFNFDPITGNKKQFTVPGYEVFSFVEDSNENIWIGSSGGLTRHNLKSGKQSFLLAIRMTPKAYPTIPSTI